VTFVVVKTYSTVKHRKYTEPEYTFTDLNKDLNSEVGGLCRRTTSRCGERIRVKKRRKGAYLASLYHFFSLPRI
jgi:hypothetical protein